MARAAEPFESVRSPEQVEVRRAFGEPIGAAETIARYTATLVDQLCAALEKKGLGARRLDLLFHRVDNRIEAIRVGTAVPVREARRMTRLLTDRIETVDPGFGIELMTLTATLAEPLRDRQTISSLVEPEEPDISDLIDVIANRLGSSRLYRFAPVESDVPERSVKRVPPTAPDDGGSWPGDWPRPSRLLTPPEPIDTMALLPDNPPVWSPGAAYAAGSPAPMAPNASSANGGWPLPKLGRCGIMSGSRMRAASASESIAPATARIQPPAATNGS